MSARPNRRPGGPSIPLRAAAASLMLAAMALVLAVLLAAPVAAKGIQEDPARYPAGVSAVVRTPVGPGQEFSVNVLYDGTYTEALMQICRFSSLEDEMADVCWTQFRAREVEGAFVADSKDGYTAIWEDGWVIGYKFTLKGPDGNTALPASGGEYFKVVVGEAAAADVASTGPVKAAPFCALCILAIGGAAMARRRMGA